MQSTLLIDETQGAVAPMRSSEPFPLNDASTTKSAETPVCPPANMSGSPERLYLLLALATYAIPFAGVSVLAWSLFLGNEKLAAYGLITTLGGCALGGLAEDDE